MTECSEHESDATSANRRSNTFDSVCEEEAPIWLTTRVSLDGGVNPDAWTCCCLTDWRVFLVARVWHLLSALRIQFHFLVRCCVFGGGGGGAIFDVRLIGGGGSCDFVLQFSCFFYAFFDETTYSVRHFSSLFQLEYSCFRWKQITSDTVNVLFSLFFDFFLKFTGKDSEI